MALISWTSFHDKNMKGSCFYALTSSFMPWTSDCAPRSLITRKKNCKLSQC
uniref:Uncharacterized protein n=1 Tax=Octopus bimaculoides TaxID=37653 RepID=A0A0L8FT54_OCTBM